MPGGAEVLQLPIKLTHLPWGQKERTVCTSNTRVSLAKGKSVSSLSSTSNFTSSYNNLESNTVELMF